MVRKRLLHAIVAFGCGLLFIGQAADAALITLNASQPQTITGQDYTFNFSPVALSNGVDGVFTVHARGDYTITAPSVEFINWDIDSLLGPQTATSSTGTVLTAFSFDDIEWEQSFVISGANLASITADNAVSIALDLSTGVNILTANSFVEATLEYESGSAVPEPSTWLLLGSGLLGLAYSRRRKSQT